MIMYAPDDKKIKIIGVGDFGAEMVNYSIANSIFGVEFAVVGTKNEMLLKSSAPQRIKVPNSALKCPSFSVVT